MVLDTSICQGQSIVFNGQTFNSTIIYVDTIQTSGGCDSIITLDLTVNPYLTGNFDTTICQGQSIVFNGVTYDSEVLTSNNVTDTVQTIDGCDSIVTLILNVNPYLTGTLDTTICQGQSIVFNGQTFNTTTIYVDTIQTSGGCDSIITLDLTVNPYLTGNFDTTICQGQSIVFNGVTYDSEIIASNNVTDTVQTIDDCDSIVTLILNVSPILTSSISESICAGGSYVFGNDTLTTAGTYYDTVSTVGGCDSAITLILNVDPYLTSTLDTSICQGQSLVFNGQTFNSTTIYVDTIQTSGGCDSIITLDLTVNPYFTGTYDTTICQGQSIVFNGVTYNSEILVANNITDTVQTMDGCDSIVTLVLNVNPYLAGTLDTTICQGQSIVFNGISYDSEVLAIDNVTDTVPTLAGCDSIVTLVLNINPILTNTFTESICVDGSYVFGGNTLTTAGTYYDTVSTIGGCDSAVTLVLSIDDYITTTFDTTICQGQNIVFAGNTYNSAITALDGITDTFSTASCDSVVTLVLHVNPYLTSTLDTAICQGQSVVFNGQTFNTTTTYTDTVQALGGCDSIITLNLTVDPYLTGIFDTSICQGQSIVFNGVNYNSEILAANNVTDTVQTIDGCDSIVTLILNVNPILTSSISESICSGGSYVFGNDTLTSAGTYYDTVSTVGGCDSAVTLILNIDPYLTGTFDTTICQGQSIIFAGNTYNTSITALDNISDTLQSVAGCDSIVTLILNVNPILTSSISENICAGSSYVFGNDTLTSAGTYYDTVSTVDGCDSAVTLILNVDPYLTGTFDTTICQGQSIVFAGNTYNTSITALDNISDTLQSVAGCDSIVTLVLNVDPILTETITESICAGGSYVFGNDTLTSAGIYYDTVSTVGGCDSAVTLILNVDPYLTGTFDTTICQGQSVVFNGQTFNTTTIYVDTIQTSGGCDSIITLDLTVNPYLTGNFDTTICQGQSIVFNGVTYDSEILAANNITDTVQTIDGCDSIVTLILNVNPILTSSISESICSGGSYIFGNDTLTSAGTYYDTVSTVGGCDSAVTLVLSIDDYITTTFDTTICQGQSIVFAGNTYNTAVTALDGITDTFSTAGCDSVVTLVLNVNPYLTGNFDTTICQGQSIVFNGVNYNSEILAANNVTDTVQTIDGCDSIVTLILNVNPILTSSISESICSGGSYVFGNDTLTSAGTYYDTVSTVGGCDSAVTLVLIINDYITTTFDTTICQGQGIVFAGNTYNSAITALDGITDTFSTASCDSIVTLVLNINPYLTSVLDTSICQGQSVVFNGQTFNTTTTYIDTVQTLGGCDSIITLNLTVNPYLIGIFDTSICQGQSIIFNGVTYDSEVLATDNVTDTVQTLAGCDSIITLVLNINPILTNTITESICAGGSYVFGGNTLTTAGTYYDTVSTVGGCDSAITLILNVDPYLTSTFDTTICQGQSIVFAGNTYNTTITVLDNITDTMQSVAGCDSVVTLVLTINPILTGTITESICAGGSYVFGNDTLNTAGTYYDTVSTVGGCDSSVTLILNVDPYLTSTFDTSICQGQSIVFAGNTYNTSITALDNISDTLQSVAGCDSIVTLVLTINPILTNTITESICAGGSYVFGNDTLTSAGTYYDTVSTVGGCDSAVTLILNVDPYLTGTLDTSICQGQSVVFNGQTFNATIIYVDTIQTSAGCDSIITLDLTVNPYLTGTFDTSICQGQSIVFNGATYNSEILASNNVTDTVQTIDGCDSIVTLILNVDPILTDTIIESICAGSSYVFGNDTLTSAGIYYDTVSTIGGCDSAIIIILNVEPYLTGTFDTTICQGQSIVFNGNTYSTIITILDNVTDTTQTTNGCDSITTLVLNILPTITLPVDTIEACWSINYQGVDYTSSTEITDTLYYSGYGCDSVYSKTYLWIHPADTQTIFLTLDGCDQVIFEGNTYTSSTQIVDTILNQYSCDSLYRNIDIIVYDVTLIVENEYLSNCESLIYDGTTYYSDTTIINVFQDVHGCDSLQRNTHLTIHQLSRDSFVVDICIGEQYEFYGQFYSQPGFYTAQFMDEFGCDSFSILILEVHPLPVLSITVEEKEFGYCIGDEIILTGEGADQYRWWSDYGMEWGTEPEVVVLLPYGYNVIWMKGTDMWSCSDSLSVAINAEPCCDLFVPNAFSPNGDGLNDGFGAESLGHPYEYNLQIFNKFGQKIFQSFDIQNKWDGTFNGKKCDVGVYHFYIQGKCADSTVIKRKGDLMLLH